MRGLGPGDGEGSRVVALVLIGAALIAAGVAVIRYRAGVAGQLRRNHQDELRYSLLNADRVERDREAWNTPAAARSVVWQAALTGAALVLLGVAVIVGDLLR